MYWRGARGPQSLSLFLHLEKEIKNHDGVHTWFVRGGCSDTAQEMSSLPAQNCQWHSLRNCPHPVEEKAQHCPAHPSRKALFKQLPFGQNYIVSRPMALRPLSEYPVLRQPGLRSCPPSDIQGTLCSPPGVNAYKLYLWAIGSRYQQGKAGPYHRCSQGKQGQWVSTQSGLKQDLGWEPSPPDYLSPQNHISKPCLPRTVVTADKGGHRM